jgi:hypothetical protein
MSDDAARRGALMCAPVREGEMREWIVAVEKAAFEHGPGVTPEDWAEAERMLGQDGPAELRELYATLDGARLPRGVELFPLRGEMGRAVLAPGASHLLGLPATDVWLFGRREEEHFFSIRKRSIDEIEQPDVFAVPAWFDDLNEEAWIYVARDETTSEVRLYRTLPELLADFVGEGDVGTEQGSSRMRWPVEGTLQQFLESASHNVEKFVAAISKGVRGKSADPKGKVQPRRKGDGRKRRPGPRRSGH